MNAAKNITKVKLLPVKKITEEMRERSHHETVVLRKEVYRKAFYHDITITRELQYGDEQVCMCSDSNLILEESDHEVSYLYETAEKSYRATLRRLGFILVECTNS